MPPNNASSISKRNKIVLGVVLLVVIIVVISLLGMNKDETTPVVNNPGLNSAEEAKVDREYNCNWRVISYERREVGDCKIDFSAKKELSYR